MNEEESSQGSACYRVSVSALIFDNEGRILLGHRRDIDWWYLPGGGMETSETVDEALHREISEEIGVEIEIGQLVGVYSKPLKDEVMLTFRCRITSGTPTTTDEIRACRYFAPHELPENTLPKHRQRIEDALLKQQTAVLRAQRSSTAEDQGLPE
jgi:8-oxo-dGTP diphosphatase